MPDVDVVIVNWNSRQYLRNCVQSLQRVQEAHPALIRSIVVVDNGSEDDSLAALEELRVTQPARSRCCISPIVIRNVDNAGFAAACNQGAELGAAPYLLFLNPDAAVPDDALDTAVSFMEEPGHAEVGICGVRLLDEDGAVAHSCARFPSASMFMGCALGLDRIFPRRFQSYHMVDWDHLSTRPVDHVIGAFYLIRRSVFARLRGFDERYFVYLEDLDLSYRARQLGYTSMYLADVYAYHKGGGSSENVKARRLFYSLRSRMLYAFKHFNAAAALLVACVTLCLEPLSRLAYALLRRSPGGVLETLKGYSYLWAWFPQYLLFGKTR